MRNKETTFQNITEGKLFILPDIGVCRKTGNVTATDKDKRERVVYPNETVGILNHNKRTNEG